MNMTANKKDTHKVSENNWRCWGPAVFVGGRVEALQSEIIGPVIVILP